MHDRCTPIKAGPAHKFIGKLLQRTRGRGGLTSKQEALNSPFAPFFLLRSFILCACLAEFFAKQAKLMAGCGVGCWDTIQAKNADSLTTA